MLVIDQSPLGRRPVDLHTSPAPRKMNTEEETMAKIAAEIKTLRAEAGVTLAELGLLFGETRASMHKIETKTRHISLIKYLGIIRYFHALRPDHPAHILINSIGVRKLNEMVETGEHPELRLSEYLKVADLSRKAFPENPALPLADHLLHG